MSKSKNRMGLQALAVAFAAIAAGAQQPAAPAAPMPPFVNAIAPDFIIPGATRFGVLRDPVRLSDFRGRTVVLAFFYQARTKG
ncbi:MAG TPA: hypothetical protein VNJ04_14895 [Gemmatimonadaceae bacterium]|nr:hypothetical protein [Gemmatimonadaceae bacterium]